MKEIMSTGLSTCSGIHEQQFVIYVRFYSHMQRSIATFTDRATRISSTNERHFSIEFSATLNHKTELYDTLSCFKTSWDH